MIAGIELGLIYAVMALGVYLTFRVLDFPDLTVDQSFTTGAATAAMIILGGGSPWLGTIAGFFAGALAGLITGLLHTKAHINGLLAGILTMTALYSINLRVMDSKANLALLREDTVFTPLREAGCRDPWWECSYCSPGCCWSRSCLTGSSTRTPAWPCRPPVTTRT